MDHLIGELSNTHHQEHPGIRAGVLLDILRELKQRREEKADIPLAGSIASEIPVARFPEPPKPKHYSFKPTGRMLTRYDEMTGEPYEIEENELVEDPDGGFVMETIKGQSFTFMERSKA